MATVPVKKPVEPVESELPGLNMVEIRGKELRYQVVIAQKNQAKLAKYYKNEKRFVVSISPLYRPYFGNAMIINVNSIYVSIPCDNGKYEIPETFAMEVAARIRKVDDQNKRANKLSDVRNNFDGSSLGSLDLIKLV